MKVAKYIIVVFIVGLWSCNGLNVKPNYEKGFIKYFGASDEDSFASQIQVLSDGFVIIGTSNADMYIAKTDFAGNKIWEKRYGGIGIDSGKAIKVIPEGGFIAVGTYASATLTGAYLVKMDSKGDTLWTKKYFRPKNVFGIDVAIDTKNNKYLLVGGIDVTNTTKGAFLLMTNFDGIPRGFSANPATYNIDNLNTLANSVIYESENLFSWVGTSGNGNDQGIQYVRVDSSLSLIGRLAQGESELNAKPTINATQIVKSQFSDSYIFIGSSINESTNFSAAYLMEIKYSSPFNASQITLPLKQYGDGSNATGSSVIELSDGSGYVLVGSKATTVDAKGNGGGIDIYIVKIKKDGSVVWQKTFGGLDTDKAVSIKETSDKGYVILASMSIKSTRSSGTSSLIALLKVNDNGELTN
ncbi:MAG: hypothetical protein EAZ53_14935 [Bacteroidetes bacterium]|nr:MAG: hypothetical protein EAZ53_14935 [Bacteroidota bacterium]